MKDSRFPVFPFLLYGATLLFIFFNRDYQNTPRIFEYDKGGYYCYLPSLFISNDLATLHDYLEVDARMPLSDQWFQGGSHVHPETGRRVVKYSLGVAMAEAPAFFVAHALAHPLGYPADGFSAPYATAVGATGILFATLGLWWLGRMLMRRHSRRTVWFVLAAIGLGTNLYTYAAFEPGMSHPVSFGLVSGFFFFIDSWYRHGKARALYAAAALLGWLVVVRPVNVLFAVPAVLWEAGLFSALRERLAFLAQRVIQLPLALVFFALTLVPQLLYWKYVSGSWIYYSYGNEGFDWTNPHIWEGLFSYKRGWMVYSPLAFFASLGFLWMKQPKHRRSLLPIFLGMAMLVYVVFSWEQWYYGAGYGARPLIDALPLMAFPLALVINAGPSAKFTVVRTSTLALLVTLIALNLFQSYQYAVGVIHYGEMNRAYYWRVFGKLHVTEEDRALMQ